MMFRLDYVTFEPVSEGLCYSHGSEIVQENKVLHGMDSLFKTKRTS